MSYFLTIILLSHPGKVFIPETILGLPVSEPEMGIPSYFQVSEVVIIECLPGHISCDVWGWFPFDQNKNRIIYFRNKT